MRKVFIGLCLLLLLQVYGNSCRLAERTPIVESSLSQTATIIHNLALKYHKTGRYSEAESLYKRALEIREKASGKDHPYTDICIHNLAMLYYQTGRHSEAEPLFKRSLDIQKKVSGKDHPNTAKSLNNLAMFYHKTGRYSEAKPLFKRALEIREKALGNEHPDTAKSISSLAILYYDTGRYSEAESLLKRALEIREKALGKDHPDTANSLSSLAILYHKTGRYSGAELLLKRALEISEKALGKDHPDAVNSLNSLAILYYDTGRYSEAEPLLKRALEISEKALGKEHPATAVSLNDLAIMYRRTGRYSGAELLLKRALEISEKILGKEHPDTAINLNNLAILYYGTGRYSEAESLYKRALDILKKTLGKDHPDTANSLSNLAVLYDETGRYSEAESLLKRALEIREKALGKDHPDAAKSLSSLAVLYYETGRYSEAEPLLRRALEIREKVLVKDHPDTAESLSHLAMLYASTNNHINSHRLFNQAVSIDDKIRENIFLLLTDKEKLSYINQTNFSIHTFINHSVQFIADNNFEAIDTLNAWLRLKSIVMETQGRLIDAVTYSEDPKIKQKFDELTNTRRLLAKLQLSDSSSLNISFDDYKKRIKELKVKKDNLEVKLTRLSKDFALEKLVGEADVTNISKILPEDSLYLDFANIKLYDFKEKKWGDSYYFVFVLLPENPPQVKLLTIAKEDGINSHINKYLTEMAKPEEHGIRVMPKVPKLDEEAKTLYEKILKPLEPYFEDKKSIYISPDGNLNLIPFEVFVTPDGKYLLEKYEVNYITAGRDIIRFTDTAKAEDRVLIIADPDYYMGLEDKKKVFAELNLTPLKGEVSKALSEMEFDRLPETKEEADAIEKLLKGKYEVKNLQDKKAIEEVLLDTKKPRLVHLSTHGFFLKDEKLEPEDNMQFQSIDKIKPARIENPMLRSGLVFAGVNKSIIDGRDDGILTAEKVLGLRLKGTELVVLSACKTGTGNVSTGEGVFGLKRAFILSGAKTVVISLWSVPSKETTELMTDFYKLMEQGKTKAEALKQSKLNMKAKKDNPFYWGAFVMVGNPK